MYPTSPDSSAQTPSQPGTRPPGIVSRFMGRFTESALPPQSPIIPTSAPYPPRNEEQLTPGQPVIPGQTMAENPASNPFEAVPTPGVETPTSWSLTLEQVRQIGEEVGKSTQEAILRVLTEQTPKPPAGITTDNTPQAPQQPGNSFT